MSATTFSTYSARPELVLDGSSSTAAWRTRTGSVTNQAITLKLSGGTSHPLYGVSVHPEGGFGPRDYEIQVSNTTADDAAFTTVATGVLTNVDARREIVFNGLTPATYVRFLWKTGLSTSFIGVRELEALEPPAGGAAVLAVSSENSVSFPVARGLDIDRISTGWITANNQITNQFVKILLPRADLWVVDRVALQGRDSCTDQSPRDFEVQVSTTTFDDAAFTTVLSATLRNDLSLQHFYLPAHSGAGHTPAPEERVRRHRDRRPDVLGLLPAARRGERALPGPLAGGGRRPGRVQLGLRGRRAEQRCATPNTSTPAPGPSTSA